MAGESEGFIKEIKKLAIIPARRGLKGVPDKNIRMMAGRPLMTYTIEAALSSGVFDTVMVSTDSEEYADIARRFGAEVLYLRSRADSSDAASSWDVVEEILKMYARQGVYYDIFCLLQPTSPLRNADHIRQAYEIYLRKAKVAVISVCEAEHSPLWCGKLGERGSLDGFISERNMVSRQVNGRYYRLNGAIYFIDIKEFKSSREP